MKTRMIIFALLATLVMLPAALADYPMFGLDPPRTADAPGFAPVTDNLIWSTDVSSVGSGYIGCGASVVDGRVYVSNWPSMGPSTGLGLHCLDESDGSIIWDNPLGGYGGVSTPAVAGDKVFVGSKDNGDLYCIDTSDGSTIWNMNIDPNPGYHGVASSPLVYGDMVYVVSFSDGTMHAIDFDGVEQWNYSASGASDMYMSVATDGSKLFFGGGNAMNCVDIATHNEEWTFNVGDNVTTTPAACDGVVYFATGKNEKKLYAVDIATGNKVWNRSLYGSLSSPAISDGKIYIGDKDKQINCIYASNGTTLWTQTIGGSCLSSPVVANGMVYTAANYDNGTIYGFDADDGTLAWSYDTGNWNMAQPSVSDGILFVGSDTGYLYAFSNMAWDGEVDLTSGTVNVTADNSGVEYTINSTCAMYALIKSAEAGGFNYSISDEWYETYGSLLFDMINDRPASGWDGWTYWVNYPDELSPSVGANCYELDDGDVVSWYWSSYSSGTGTNPGNSDMLIQTRVCVTELPNVVWNGSVDLTSGTVNVTADNSGVEYTINSTCAMYALIKSAEAGGFNYSISDEWYETYGSLLFDMINDRPAEGWDGWNYWVNYPDDPSPSVGANCYELDDGDVVSWYWSSYSSGTGTNPGNSDMLIQTRVCVTELPNVVWNGSVDLTSGTVNVTADNSGVEYTINSTCAMYALIKSAEAGGFNYSISDEWYETYGSLLFDMINDRPAEGWDGWNYWVNYPDDPSPSVGANCYELDDGDVVSWYWSSYSSGTGTNPGNSDMLIQTRVCVTELPNVVWNGSVDLTSGTVNVTADNSGEEYTISSTCAMYATIRAAEAGGFNYSISDAWYDTYGSLYFDMINDRHESGSTGWLYRVNYPDGSQPPSPNLCELEDGDLVILYWGIGMGATPDNSDMLIQIKVVITERGDLNHDGTITPADAAIALQMAVGAVPAADAADLSGDGVVTSLDALMILQVAAGAITISSRL